VFLTADVRRAATHRALTPEQAMYWFLSGYTAKVVGTERGVTELQAAFSKARRRVPRVAPRSTPRCSPN
jgi:phosphoenolpyruvate carboxykinase (ATP)